MTSLFYVIGASGCGKDSVMDYARQRLAVDDPCVFAHRYITRPASAGGENHVALSDQQFELRESSGLFSLCWESHGLRYGVGLEIEQWLGRGLNVVVNGSRGYLEEATARFPSLVPVHITASGLVLRERLLRRERESVSEIEARLARADSFSVAHPRLQRICNDGPLQEAGEMFLRLLRKGVVSLASGSEPRPVSSIG